MATESNLYKHLPIEEMGFFKQYEEVADKIWFIVKKWDWLAVDTVRKQIVRAADRVCATLVEGDGRHTNKDAVHFFTMARGSARETRFWLRRAVVRGLVISSIGNELLSETVSATRQLNKLIRYRRSRIASDSVHETLVEYKVDGDDPFVDDN